MSPTVSRSRPYRLLLFSNEEGEPPHIHVQRERMLAKFWLDPVVLARSTGFSPRELRVIQAFVAENAVILMEVWDEHFAIEIRPLAPTVEVSDDELTVGLADGRVITVPLVWFPRLMQASPESRNKWELLGDGEGIHWPEADEDLSVEGSLAGTRARGVA